MPRKKKEEDIITHIAYEEGITLAKRDRLEHIAFKLGHLRDQFWQELCTPKILGIKYSSEIRDKWMAEKRDFGVPPRLWKALLDDTFKNIKAYWAAAKEEIENKIYKRFKKGDKNREALLKLLWANKWDADPYLHRLVRQHFKHGKNHTHNQIYLDSGCYDTFIHNGKAWVDVQSLESRNRIAIPLNTTQVPKGSIRIILKDTIEIHYGIKYKEQCKATHCGDKVVGVDKGYTYALATSEGEQLGLGLGKVLYEETKHRQDKLYKRGKLREVQEKAIAKGDFKKAQRIEKNNLGTKKWDAHKHKFDGKITNILAKSIHKVVDYARILGVEYLGWQGDVACAALSDWPKGKMQRLIKQISKGRGASDVTVNAAFTSQICNACDCFGDRKQAIFYCPCCREFYDANLTASANVKDRLYDDEITLYMSVPQVRAILLKRGCNGAKAKLTPEEWEERTRRLKLPNPDSSCKVSEGSMVCKHTIEQTSSTESELVARDRKKKGKLKEPNGSSGMPNFK